MMAKPDVDRAAIQTGPSQTHGALMKRIDIGTHIIGPGHPCFIIAEAGVNHNGDEKTALALIDAAKSAGADAVKFQSFKADNVITPGAPKAAYQKQTTSADESQLDMVKRLELSADVHWRLQAHCRETGILFLSTPFDEENADLLESMGLPLVKVPSGEITNLDFIRYVAAKGKPLLVSTGMACLGEVETAVRTVELTGNDRLALLHCVSNYPAHAADVNLRAMAVMSEAFGLPVGYSDHTLGMEVALAAVALGACVIEKHFTLDRAMPGPDHRASLEPHELAAMVRGIRTVESAMGNGRKQPAPSEAAVAEVARRSLVAAMDIKSGTVLTAGMIAVKRPGTGLAPSFKSIVVGRRAVQDIPAGALLSWESIS
jgi:N,N'-diacetyllegionaminate synthase